MSMFVLCQCHGLSRSRPMNLGICASYTLSLELGVENGIHMHTSHTTDGGPFYVLASESNSKHMKKKTDEQEEGKEEGKKR